MTEKHFDLHNPLKSIFGFETFNTYQKEIIETVLEGKDCLAVLPTGSGKSLCYQLPAILLEGLTVVVSPLISLMKDQVMQLNQLGQYAVLLNSALTKSEYAKNIRLIQSGDVKVLYAAPETLMKEGILDFLSEIEISLFTVDEAHCISEWGHDFRSEYRQLFLIRERLGNPPCLALTATATSRVREDIIGSLRLKHCKKFIASFDRPNLFLEVKPKEKPTRQVFEFIKKFPDQSGIIYCFSRKQTESLCSKLEKEGYSVRSYHAGLSDSDREVNQEMFIRDDIKIIVATVAFGMGINKPDVRFVVHYDLPKNIESYYQEIGRAGRDGLPSNCLLLLSYGDINKIRYLIDQKVNDSERRIANIHLSTMVQYAESLNCRRISLLGYFGELVENEHCNNCDVCVSDKSLEKENLTEEAQKFMSCVKRTGEVFGMGYVIDVLRGSKMEKILRNGHDSLSTYNIGAEYSKSAWQQLARQLIQKQLISQNQTYGSLFLTARARPVLKGEEEFYGVMDKKKPAERKKPLKEYVFKSGDYDRVLFKILREKRKELADKSGIPPYMVFPDKTLVQMSEIKPISLDAMKELHGVGNVKFRKYGQLFFDIISSYRESS